MDLSKDVGSRGPLARGVPAVVLAVVAIRSLREGKRLRGALAGIGALALGYTATTAESERKGAAESDTTGEDADLRCAICGQPIRPGQRRGPNADNEIVHEACAEPAD